MVKIQRIGKSIYLVQSSTGDPRGNRYVGPFSSTRDLEIFAYRVMIFAKQIETGQGAAEMEVA